MLKPKGEPMTVRTLGVATLLVVGHLVGGLGRLLAPRGADAVLLLFSCLAVLVLACSIPFRAVPPRRNEAVHRRGAGLTSAA